MHPGNGNDRPHVKRLHDFFNSPQTVSQFHHERLSPQQHDALLPENLNAPPSAVPSNRPRGNDARAPRNRHQPSNGTLIPHPQITTGYATSPLSDARMQPSTAANLPQVTDNSTPQSFVSHMLSRQSSSQASGTMLSFSDVPTGRADFQNDTSRQYRQTPEAGLTVSCTMCANTYTGNWAQRNLNRHMEHKHAQSEKIVRCEVCQRAYHRRDALLKHERDRHPELKRQPHIPRKRSTESPNRGDSPVVRNDAEPLFYSSNQDLYQEDWYEQ